MDPGEGSHVLSEADYIFFDFPLKLTIVITSPYPSSFRDKFLDFPIVQWLTLILCLCVSCVSFQIHQDFLKWRLNLWWKLILSVLVMKEPL